MDLMGLVHVGKLPGDLGAPCLSELGDLDQEFGIVWVYLPHRAHQGRLAVLVADVEIDSSVDQLRDGILGGREQELLQQMKVLVLDGHLGSTSPFAIVPELLVDVGVDVCFRDAGGLRDRADVEVAQVGAEGLVGLLLLWNCALAGQR